MLKELCTDIILGTDFQELHQRIAINYGRSKPPLSFIPLTTMKTNPPSNKLIIQQQLTLNQQLTLKLSLKTKI